MDEEEKNSPEGAAVDSILRACRVLGWQVALPAMEDSEADVPGVIIGTPEYVDHILSHLPEGFEGARLGVS